MRVMQVEQSASAQPAGSDDHLIRFLILVLSLAFPTIGTAQQGHPLQGKVFDSNRVPVSNVRIEFRSAAETRLETTDDNGSFTVSNVAGGGTLLVSHPGFAPVTILVGPETVNDPLQIYLQPAPIVERIIVSSGEDRVSSLPNSQFSLSKQEIELSGSLALDDVLREAPGFSLFRRSGSLVANPTSQGVSLRGVGANGASRAEVLLDGVPLNTPFGAWVYWERVPKLS